MKVVVDTSIIIDHIRAKTGIYSELTALAQNKSVKLYIPTVVILELWKGESLEDREVEKSLEKMLQIFRVVPLTKQLAKTAGSLVRKDVLGDFIDATVAATALYLNAQLATRNIKHFKKVKKLRLYRS